MEFRPHASVRVPCVSGEVLHSSYLKNGEALLSTLKKQTTLEKIMIQKYLANNRTL